MLYRYHSASCDRIISSYSSAYATIRRPLLFTVSSKGYSSTTATSTAENPFHRPNIVDYKRTVNFFTKSFDKISDAQRNLGMLA